MFEGGGIMASLSRGALGQLLAGARGSVRRTSLRFVESELERSPRGLRSFVLSLTDFLGLGGSILANEHPSPKLDIRFFRLLSFAALASFLVAAE